MVPFRDELRPPPVPRIRAAVSNLLGRLVMLLGLWTTMLLIFIAVFGANGPITMAGLAQWIVAAVLCAAVLRLGLKLTRGHRNMVLFLRKFGYQDAITMVSRSVASAMKRRWRLITLDDSDVEPIGVPETRHWVIASIATLGVFLLLSGSESLFGVEGIDLGAGFALMALLHVAAAEGNRALAARSANSGRSTRLNKPAQVNAITKRLQTLSGRVIAPPLMVVTVDERIWQEAVERLAAASTTVLIDISDPTENLLWEIKTLRPDLEGRWAFICEDRHFHRREGTERSLDCRDQLDHMLAGEQVILYSASDAGQGRHFSRALRRKLEST